MAEDDLRAREEQFDRAVRPVLGRLVRISRRILGSEDLAWDAVQEALLCLWRQEPPPPDPRSWLVRAAIYRSLHLARSLRRRRKHEERACRVHPEASERDEASGLVAAGEVSATLIDALSRLGDKHRDVLRLLVFEGMDYESIAGALGIPVGTVRSRINRSRGAIRLILGEARPGGPGLDE